MIGIMPSYYEIGQNYNSRIGYVGKIEQMLKEKVAGIPKKVRREG